MTILTSYYKQNLKSILLLLLFIQVAVLFTNAQYGTKAVIRNVDFELVDSKVIITYDLAKAKSRDLFNIDVAIYSTSGYKIDAQTIEGMFTDVQKGKDKEIKWHLGKDYNFFEDNIYVELTAFHKNHLKVKRVSRIEAFMKSTIWPGWGSSQTTLKKINYAKGVLAYGFLTASAISYNRGVSVYTNHDVAVFTAGMAAIIWMWDYGKILFSPNVSNNIKLDIEASNYNNQLSPILSMKVNL